MCFVTGHLVPGPVWRQLPGQFVVGQDHLEDFPKPCLDFWRRDVDEGFDTTVKVALHHVGRPHQVAAAIG